MRWRLRAMEPEQMILMSLRVLAADPRTIPEEVVQLLVDQARARRDDPDAVRSFLEAARGRCCGWAVAPDLAARTGQHRVPGPRPARAAGPVGPGGLRARRARASPGWRRRFFRDLGHIPQMEAPGRWLAEVADWYAATYG